MVPADLARANGVPIAGNPVVFCLCINDVTRNRWTVVADEVDSTRPATMRRMQSPKPTSTVRVPTRSGSRAYGGLVANSPWIAFPSSAKGGLKTGSKSRGHVPSAALDVLGGLRLEDGREWGEAAAPEQWTDAEAILDPSSPPYSFLTRPRGCSKTSDLAGICVAACSPSSPPGRVSTPLQATGTRGASLTDAMAGFVDRTAELSGSIGVDSFKATAKNGSTLEVLAADGAGALGLRPALRHRRRVRASGPRPGNRSSFGRP